MQLDVLQESLVSTEPHVPESQNACWRNRVPRGLEPRHQEGEKTLGKEPKTGGASQASGSDLS